MLNSPNPNWNYKKVESLPYTNDTTATASVNTEKFGWNDKTVRINGEETKSNRLNEISGLADRVKSITDRLDAAKKIETDPKKKESINVLIKKITLRFVYIENMRKAGLDDLPFDTNADGKIDEAYSEISFIVLNEQKAILENLLTEATALLDNKEEAKVEMKVAEPEYIPFDSVTPTTPEAITPNKVESNDMADMRSQINALNARVDTLQQQVDYLSNANGPYRSILDMDDQVRANFNQAIQDNQADSSLTTGNVVDNTVPDVVDNSRNLDSRVVNILKGRELPRDMIDDYQFLMQNRYDANGKEKDEFLPEFNFFLSELTRKLGDIKAYSSKPMGVVPGDETVRSEPLDETLLSSPVIDTPSLDDTVPTSYNLEEEKMVKDEIMKDFDDQKSQLQRVPFTTMLARSESLSNKYQQLLEERDFMTVREFKEAVYKLLGEIKLVDRMAPPVPGANQVIPNPKPFDTDMPVPISKTPLS